MPDPVKRSPDDPAVEWLSGEFLTFLNKLLLPVLWFVILLGTPLWVLATSGGISVASGFRFLVGFVVIATVPLSWLVAHLQRVGYSGTDLVIANYWRRARIPFREVEAVEPVWWYRGRLVRVRFRSRTAFGTLVYYLPKWGPLRAMVSAPEKQLQRLIWPEL